MSYENNTDATTNNNNIQVDWEVVVVISHNDTSGGVLTEDMDDIGEHIYHASEYDPTNDMVHLYQLDDNGEREGHNDDADETKIKKKKSIFGWLFRNRK